MKKFLGITKSNFGLGVLIFAFFALLYVIILKFAGSTDFSGHLHIARQQMELGTYFQGNFLFYLLVNLFSVFSEKWWLMKVSFCVLLAFATACKFILVETDLRHNNIDSSWYWALSLLFVFIVPLFSTWNSSWYLCGYLVPTIWHNSTTLFLFPFAFALFLLAQKQLKSYDRKRNVYILLLILLNIWIKPSYFFVFVCVYPLFLLFRYGFKSKHFYYALIPVIAGGIFLLCEYISIYYIKAYNPQDDSSVIISFSNITSVSWLSNRLKYAFVSLLFPFLYGVLHYRQVAKDRTFWFVWLQVFVAVLIYWICYETGERATHGNFYWQIVVCVWMLFFYTLRSLLISIKHSTSVLYKRMDYVLLSFYGVHVLFGLLYLIRMFVLKTYY